MELLGECLPNDRRFIDSFMGAMSSLEEMEVFEEDVESGGLLSLLADDRLEPEGISISVNCEFSSAIIEGSREIAIDKPFKRGRTM